MNARYRKQMRLRSRHYRRGHTPWCYCWEPWQALFLNLEGWRREKGFPALRRLDPGAGG